MGKPVLEHPRSARRITKGRSISHFAPAPPEGLESNWVPTSKDGQFEVLCRFYGPEKSFFDKTCRLPDVERVH